MGWTLHRPLLGHDTPMMRAAQLGAIRQFVGRCRQWWCESPTVNRVRRAWYYGVVALVWRGRASQHLKLHLGCGSQRLEGFINIDFRRTDATDLILNVVSLPFADGAAQRIEAYHFIEHLSACAASAALRQWLRVLEPGGELIIECPDFDQACREYLAGNTGRLTDIFGAQRFEGDFHLYGYSADRLCATLREIGFVSVTSGTAQDYHCQWGPCLRVEATKPHAREPSWRRTGVATAPVAAT